MLHRVRTAMKTGSFSKFAGEVESDETFIGGHGYNMHVSRRKAKFAGQRGHVGKAVVHGLLERGGKVRAQVVKNNKGKTLRPIIRENVDAGSRVYTDALQSYIGLSPEFVHKVVDHAKAYVEGRVHTNCLENFWSLLKRTIGGTYVSVDVPHLDRYIDEQAWRFNERKLSDSQRFAMVMPGVIGRRLTYSALIGQNTAEGLASSDEAGANEFTN